MGLGIKAQKKGEVRSYRFISVLDKMIMKDLFKTVIAVLSVIVIIIVSRKFIKVLAKAVEGNISNETVVTILGFNTVIAFSTFLPASIFMAILMVLGRMYKDQEMSAVASAGGGAVTIYRAVFLLIIPLSFVALALSMYATPWAEAEIRQQLHHDLMEIESRGIAAGRFSEFRKGDLVFYAESVDSKKRMKNVFAQTRSDNGTGIINAKHGQMKFLPGGLYLVLEEGERIQGNPGELNYIIEKFKEYAVRIENKTTILEKARDGKPSKEIWASNALEDVAELQSRLSVPLGVLCLSFLAVPLAKLSPRSGVYGSLAVAFGIYFIYGNLNKVSQSWVVNGIMPSSVGYFGVYLLLLLLGIALLIRLYGIKWIVNTLKQQGTRG